uniref:Uncharacterized protein n=1 Tax=Rhizophora mucronata TaxID=61149 RepID=A0A2P2M1Q0_RHIMU
MKCISKEREKPIFFQFFPLKAATAFLNVSSSSGVQPPFARLIGPVVLLLVGEAVAGLDTPGDLRIALPLPSEIDGLKAAVNCLFSRQRSSIFASPIPSSCSSSAREEVAGIEAELIVGGN